MQPDRMGNHTNVKGVAVFRIAFDKQGRVDCAETVSGHPIAVSLLNASMRRLQRREHARGHSVRRLEFHWAESLSLCASRLNLA
jgi:hypothetical protein